MSHTKDCRSRLHKVLKEVDSLMSGPVYDALFDAVAKEKPKQILEIGTAHGAGTIAMALGAEAEGLTTQIQTVDTLEALPDIPSSRSKYGNAHANEAIVRENFRRAGVADRISLFVGRSDAYATTPQAERPIDMLVLDADGRLDRDLLLFRKLMAPDCLIVVDDIDGEAHASFSRRGLSLDLKHVISEKLTTSLVAQGYLSLEKRIWNTSFFRAVEPQLWNEDAIRTLAMSCYRELIFLDVKKRSIFISGIVSLLSMNVVLRPIYGGARKLYRRMKNRSEISS